VAWRAKAWGRRVFTRICGVPNSVTIKAAKPITITFA
jgi:hypothetical protein